jgi:3-oxoacyl-[acyl-carrier protein] reductase
VTFKIEKHRDRYSTTIRLIGRMRADHLSELEKQISESESKIALDLEELNLVDVEAVRFLGMCETQGCSTVRPTYATGSTKSEIKGIGRKTMPTKLEGKIALVTGGSRGIGAAIAKRLAADGANVAITYTKGADAAASVVKEIERFGRKAIAIQADATDATAVEGAVEKTVATFGRLDVLVNNAGTAIPKTFEESTLEEMDRMIDINLRGVFVATQAALKHMKSGGRIISIGSAVGERVQTPGLVPYSATKGAVKLFTQGLSREVGSRGITVNNVQPGPIDTDLNPAAGDWAIPQKAATALNRYGHVDEVAALVAFVAGPGSSYITGANLTVDGGMDA